MTAIPHFIHGFNSSHYSFAYMAKEFGAVSNIDYKSAQPLADSVKQVARALPKDDPIILIGHSLGGVIAMEIALAKTHNVQKVVTISSPLGGSKTAMWVSWFMSGSFPILRDIAPTAAAMCRFQIQKPPCDVLSVISTGGHLPTSGEQNDSIVSISSQKALKYAKKVEVKANHFEVLNHDRTIEAVRTFIES